MKAPRKNRFLEFFARTPVWLWPVLILDIRRFIRWSEEMLAAHEDVICWVDVNRQGRLEIYYTLGDAPSASSAFGDVARKDGGLQAALCGDEPWLFDLRRYMPRLVSHMPVKQGVNLSGFAVMTARVCKLGWLNIFGPPDIPDTS